MSERSRRWKYGLLAMLLALPVLGPLAAFQPAAAQRDESSYDFAGGQLLTWNDDWELDDDLTYVDDGLESVTLTQGVSLFSVLSVPNDFELDEARDIYLDSLLEEVGGATTIDRGAYGSVSYSLDLVTIEGFEFGVFTLFRAGTGSTPTFAYIFFSEVAAFSSLFESAQDAFRLDDAPIYEGVDGGGLQVLLESVGSDPQGVTEDAEDRSAEDLTDESSVDPAEDDPAGEGGFGGLKSGRDEVPTRDVSDGGNLLSDAAYVSPQYGVELDWGSSWQLDPEADAPTDSDMVSGIDSLTLLPVEGGGFMSITFIDAGVTGVPDLVEVWESADFVADSAFSAEAEVVLAGSSRDVGAMVLRDYLEEGTELVVIREASLAGDNAMVVVQLSTTPANLDSVVSSAQDEIELDGTPVLAFFSIDEIAEEFGV